MVAENTSPAAELLALSDERDRQLAMRLAAWREGWRFGYAAGYRRGREDEADETAERWRRAAVGIKECIRDTPEWKASAARRLADALSFERRDAWEHWRKRWAELHALSRDRAYVRQARTIRPWKRSYEQNVAIMLSDGGSDRGEAA